MNTFLIALSIILFISSSIVLINIFNDIDLFKLEMLKRKIINSNLNTRFSFAIISGGVLLLFLTKIFIVLPACIILALALPDLLFKRIQEKNNDLKMELWPVLIDDIASGVKAGSPLNQALLQAMLNIAQPLRSDFVEAIHEFNKTNQISRVLNILDAKIKDEVGKSIVNFLQVVNKTGANDLAQSLNVLANSAREANNLLTELKAKQAWVLNGARVSVFAPWLVLIALWTQTSVRVAYQSITGQVILTMVAGVGVAGYLVMKRIGQIQIYRKAEIL